jgi:hypothetical protein
MAEPHVITALSKKRAQLSGDIERTQHELQDMIRDLEHLDRTLLLFDPSYEIASIKPKAFRPPADWSKRGEMTRLILGILRKAAEPLTSRDIALQLMAERALDVADEKLLRLMVKRVEVALRGQRDNGAVSSDQGPGMYQCWRVAKRSF